MALRRIRPAVLAGTAALIGLSLLHMPWVALGATSTPPMQAWTRTSAVNTFTPQAGRVYVAVTGGQEEARTFLRLPSAPPSASSLTLQEVSESFNETAASLLACPLRGPIPAAGELDPSQAPAPDCTTSTHLRRAASGVWELQLGDLATVRRALDANGIGLVAEARALATWRLAFDTTRTSLVLQDPPIEAPTRPATPISPSGSTVDPSPQASTSPASPTESPRAWRTSPMDNASPPSGLAVPTSNGTSPSRPTLPDRPPTVLPGKVTTHTASAPNALVVLGILALVYAIALAALRQRRPAPQSPFVARSTRSTSWPSAFGPAAAVLILGIPLLGSESTIYKVGTIMIFCVAALGLHIIVNWTGQLSLAHAGMVGVPAFATLAVSDRLGISPIYLLPFAAATGAFVGAVVALPTLRAKGLQVALVTLTAGIAIDRFFFTATWLVGPGSGRQAATPTLGPITFATSRSLYPVLVAVTVFAAAALWALMHSRIARAWYWVRADAAAASAFGIPITAYRIGAFAAGGCFAGVAGGLTVMWVQRLTPATFPTSLSFAYLLVTVLAGPGYLGGLVAASVFLQGGTLFPFLAGAAPTYIGAFGLVFSITRYPKGINGAGRTIMERLTRHSPSSSRASGIASRPLLAAGLGLLGVGFVCIALAWYHTGNTDQLWIQNQELASGSIGGIALVIVGSSLLVCDYLTRAADALRQSTLTNIDSQVVTETPEASFPSVNGDLAAASPLSVGPRRTRGGAR